VSEKVVDPVDDQHAHVPLAPGIGPVERSLDADRFELDVGRLRSLRARRGAGEREQQARRQYPCDHTFFGFQGLNALSSSIPSIAKAIEGKCREMTLFIELSSIQSIPSFV
jgi:hypothetical protein